MCATATYLRESLDTSQGTTDVCNRRGDGDGGDGGPGVLAPDALRGWARPGLRAGEWHERAVAALKGLRVLLQTVSKGGDVRLRLNPAYGRGLRAAMAGLTPPPFGLSGANGGAKGGGVFDDGGGGHGRAGARVAADCHRRAPPPATARHCPVCRPAVACGTRLVLPGRPLATIDVRATTG